MVPRREVGKKEKAVARAVFTIEEGLRSCFAREVVRPVGVGGGGGTSPIEK